MESRVFLVETEIMQIILKSYRPYCSMQVLNNYANDMLVTNQYLQVHYIHTHLRRPIVHASITSSTY